MQKINLVIVKISQAWGQSGSFRDKRGRIMIVAVVEGLFLPRSPHEWREGGGINK